MKPFVLDADRVCNAFYLAHASAAAYEDSPEDYASFSRLRLARLRTFAGQDEWARGFVGAREDAVVVVFRGTNRPADWITNVSYLQVEGYGGKVHRGFAWALDSIWREVLECVRLLRDKDQKVWIAGHSLGGALATLAARRLEPPYSPHAAYTFGQPRVGDPAFAEGYAERLYRFVNNRDIVPNFPLPGIFNRYRHVGRLHWLDARLDARGRDGAYGHEHLHGGEDHGAEDGEAHSGGRRGPQDRELYREAQGERAAELSHGLRHGVCSKRRARANRSRRMS
jgi:hypothetical protein